MRQPFGIGAWLPLTETSIGTDRLLLGQKLLPGQSLVSQSGKFELAFGTEGQRLTLWTRDPGARDKWLWISEPKYDSSKENTWRACRGGQAIMQTDGNFAQLGSKGETCWETRTANMGAAYVILQDDGNLVVYTAQHRALWGAGTQGGHRSPSFTDNSIIDAIGADISSIPVVGDIVHIVGEAAAAPFQLAIAIGTGERLDHALVGALKEQLKIVKDVAPYAQTIVSFVPGLGTGVAMMIGAGAALAEGKSIDDVAEAAIRGALPGGPAVVAAYDMARKLAHGENFGKAALESARGALPAAAQKAFDVGVAVATGRQIQEALASGFASLAPGQLQNLIAAGKTAVASVPGLSDALKTVAGPAQDGFHAAAAMLSSTGLNEKSLVALRNQLTPVLRQGFDAALKTQTKNIPWLANVTNAPATSAPNMADPKKAAPTTRAPTMADPTKKTVAYAPYPKKAGVAGLGLYEDVPGVPAALRSIPYATPASLEATRQANIQAINAIQANIAAGAAAATRHAPIMADPTPRTHAPVMADPRAHASSAYAPYPKAGVGVGTPWWDNWRDEWDDDIQSMKQMYGLAAPPPHGHPGGGHPFAARPHGHGGGQPDFWWGVPYSPETTDMACRTWGPAIAIPPPMQTAARVALNVSKGAPTTVRGPDNRLYLFSIENGQITARPCAVG